MSWLYTLVFVGMMMSHSAPQRISIHSTDVDTANATQISQQQNETERIEKSFPLNANGRVSVSNVNGSINIVAWERNEVRLVAVKTANTKESLANVEIKIDARPDYLRVESDYGDDRTWKGDSDRKWRNNDNVTVNYELSVPRTAVLNEIETVNGSVAVADFVNYVKVSAVNGTVRAGNLRGTAELSTVNGELIADFDRLSTGNKIDLDTVNGRVSLTIPSDANATVKAESLNGSITNDFGLPSRRGKYVGNSLHGKLGTGEVNIKLESVNGTLSVKHRNDGKSLSPATNLLPAKGDDEDGDGDGDMSKADTARMNRDIDRSVRQSQRDAMRGVEKEKEKIKAKATADVSRVRAEIDNEVLKAVDVKKIQESIDAAMSGQQVAMAGLRDINFFNRMPRVEVKSNAFTVKGTPKVTIDAKGCAVRVRGTDGSEVKYSLTQMKGGMSSQGATVAESHTDSVVSLKVVQPSDSDSPGFFGRSAETRIEVFVPRKTNLKIISDQEVRLDGVSGELEIIGGDESVDIRDSDGKLNITNESGRVRVIGFEGDVNANTDSGDVYLEGKFSKLTGKADSGSFIVTIPTDSNVDITADTEVQTEGFSLTERGSNKWRLGSGGATYSFAAANGQVTFRNSSVLNPK